MPLRSSARRIATIAALLVTAVAPLVAQAANDRAASVQAIDSLLRRSRAAFVAYSAPVEGKCKDAVTQDSKRRYWYGGFKYDAGTGGYELAATETYSSTAINTQDCTRGVESSGASVTTGFRLASLAGLKEIEVSPAQPPRSVRAAGGKVSTQPEGSKFLILTFDNGRTYRYLVALRGSQEQRDLRRHFLRLRQLDGGR